MPAGTYMQILGASDQPAKIQPLRKPQKEQSVYTNQETNCPTSSCRLDQKSSRNLIANLLMSSKNGLKNDQWSKLSRNFWPLRPSLANKLSVGLCVLLEQAVCQQQDLQSVLTSLVFSGLKHVLSATNVKVRAGMCAGSRILHNTPDLG